MRSILFVLTLASDRAILYENVAILTLVFSTKKRYSNLLKKVFVFQTICFKIKVLKTLQTSSDIKTCRSLKRRVILEIPTTLF